MGSIICDIDFQLTYLLQLTGITESLKEKCMKSEKEKSEAIRKCESLQAELEKLNSKKCTNCSLLANELRKERLEKENLKKVERGKILKSIARTLENFEDRNTNQVNQLLTELNCGNLSESQEQKDERGITLIEDNDTHEDEEESRILVNETMIVENNRASCVFKGQPIVIPETEATECFPKKTSTKHFKDIILPKLKNPNSIRPNSKENVIIPDDGDVKQPNKKLRLSPILSSEKVSPPRDNLRVNQSAHSPSVLSEIIEAAGGLGSRRTAVGETLEDPDLTVFNPAITSTCLPVPDETSFDRLPDLENSPKYKYRREALRKKCERLKLPGQDCDQCAKYYEAAGLDQTQDVRARLNQCSRHRDKYQLRANTPPGFWDPVLPSTPESSQDH